MGRSSSKFMETPKNPLQELEMEERRREQRKRKQEKQQRQIAKLQRKQASKNKCKETSQKVRENAEKQTTKHTRHVSDSEGSAQRTSCLNSQSTSCEMYREEFNRQIEQHIQNHLDNDLCTFVMNQVTLAVQFFGNYENELTIISEELLAKENELNQNLEEHSILITTLLDAAVSKWLQYKPVHGPNKHNPQPLQPLKMYIIFENIDIARPNDANYDSISPLCKVDLDTDFYNTTPCKEDYVNMLRETKWKGYVRLKMREELKLQRMIVRDHYTDGSSGYSTASAHSFKSYSSTVSSSRRATESDYDYAYIEHLNAHHPLAELKMMSLQSPEELDVKVLPDTCVSTLGEFIEPLAQGDTDLEGDYDESDEEEGEEDNETNLSSENEIDAELYLTPRKQRYSDYETVQAIRFYKLKQERRKVLLKQSFLNSKEFMRYFGELIRQQLAERLYITAEELNEATYRGTSIHTKYCELIPAIYVAHNAQHWPDCAFQFRIRERPISRNPLTGQPTQWPTRAMIRRIESFGFHVIPDGYAPKRHRNPFRELEWRIVFPKAERYLEQNLTSTQVKVFMITKALVKTFVEPQEKHQALMFTIDHMRMHLFWECERNFSAWPEEYLGEVYQRFIGSFMQRLREKCLRDYFIEERNLFESIPEYSLIMLLSILTDIYANPLMHMMVALRNLDYVDSFFPKLNYKKLFHILSENNMLKLRRQAKNSRNLIALDVACDALTDVLRQDDGARGLVGMKQHHEKANVKLRRKTHVMRHNIELKRKQEYERRRLSEESIDVEFFFRRNLNSPHLKHINQGVENLRRTNILEIFIDHLLTMAEKARDFRTLYLAKTLLAQARRLCKFYHNYGCDMGAHEYISRIESIEEEIKALQGNEDSKQFAPALPTRSSIECGKSSAVREIEDDNVQCVRRTVRVDIEIRNNERENLKAEVSKKINIAPVDEAQKSIKFNEANVSESITKTIGLHRKSGKSQYQSCEDYDAIENCDFYDETAINSLEENVVNVEAEAETEQEKSCNAKQSVTRNENPKATQSTPKSGMLHRNLTLGNSQILKDISASTEKFMAAMSSEEIRLQLKDMVKRKTVQLKGAFNQCSET